MATKENTLNIKTNQVPVQTDIIEYIKKTSKKNTKSIPVRKTKDKPVLRVVELLKKNEVRYELQTALSPLFQPINDARKREKRLVRRQLKDGWVEFACFEELSIFDESVVLAILRISGENHTQVTDTPRTAFGKEMRKLIDPDEQIKGKITGIVSEMSLYEIAQNMGYKKPNAKTYEYIRASLTRLGRVSMSHRSDIFGIETHGDIGFVRHKILDNGRLSAIMNPRLTMACFGDNGWKFSLLSLDERNSLKGDIAKSAHRFLVSWLWRDNSRPIRLDTLASHVWFKWGSLSANAKSTMRKRLKTSLSQIDSLNSWGVTISGRGSAATICVSRGKTKEK